jgi:hypothetical protein
MSDRPQKRRGPLLWLADRSRRFWIGVALVSVLYVASFGPACWFLASHRRDVGPPIAGRLFWPVGWIANNGPHSTRRMIEWYATRRHDVLLVPCTLAPNEYVRLERRQP